MLTSQHVCLDPTAPTRTSDFARKTISCTSSQPSGGCTKVTGIRGELLPWLLVPSPAIAKEALKVSLNILEVG